MSECHSDAFFVWLQSASTVLRACLDSRLFLQERSRCYRLKLLEVIRQPIGFATQPTNGALLRRPCGSLHTTAHHDLSPGVGGGGPRVCGEPWASQSQWSELASEDAAFLFSPVVGFATGACTRVASR